MLIVIVRKIGAKYKVYTNLNKKNKIDKLCNL